MEEKKHDYKVILIGLSLLFSITGILLAYYSSNLGMSAAESWLIGKGSFNSEEYYNIQQGYMNSILTIGGILLGAGLAGLLSFVVLQYKKSM
ncbi:hypothetical protein V1503_06170 [Bacillus sp. SCS-151]|uniref:hypothetical protein n=1 Tax=Nanhaiella sioensis TaxID=3115293 RepID=UPI00397A232D